MPSCRGHVEEGALEPGCLQPAGDIDNRIVIDSTAAKPAFAAAAKRSGKGTSLNIMLRLAANLGMENLSNTVSTGLRLVISLSMIRHADDASLLQILRKKSGVPKLPDLSASARGPLPVSLPIVVVHGTPELISGPMRKAQTLSALTTAPEVARHLVRQQRGQRFALRRAFRPCIDHFFGHHARFQIMPDQFQNPFIFYAARHSRHRNVVIYPVKEFLQIKVNHPTAFFRL